MTTPDTAAIRARSQQPGYQEGQALQDVLALCDALDNLAKRDRELRMKVERMVTQITRASNQARYRRAEIKGHQRRIVSLRAENERLRAGLVTAQSALAMTVTPGKITATGVQTAWAACVEAEAGARAALAQKEAE